MPKDTKSSGYNKAPACESRGFGYKKEGANFDTPSWQNFPKASKNIFEDGGTLRKLQKLFLRFSESSKTVESDAIRARNRITSFPSPIGVEEMTTFAIGTFISMSAEIVALSLNHIRCRIQRAQPIKIV